MRNVAVLVSEHQSKLLGWQGAYFSVGRTGLQSSRIGKLASADAKLQQN